MAKWIGHWTHDQKVWGFDSHCWPCVEELGKLLIQIELLNLTLKVLNF